jgi:hypothetical protein
VTRAGGGVVDTVYRVALERDAAVIASRVGTNGPAALEVGRQPVDRRRHAERISAIVCILDDQRSLPVVFGGCRALIQDQLIDHGASAIQ